MSDYDGFFFNRTIRKQFAKVLLGIFKDDKFQLILANQIKMNSSEDVIFYFCSTSYGLVGYILHAIYFYKPLHRKMNKETEQQSKSKKYR